jgi:competence protein ComEC
VPPVARFTIAFAAGLWVGRVLVPPLVVPGVAVALAGALAPRFRWPAVLLGVGTAGMAQGLLAAREVRGACAARWPAGRHAAIVRLANAPDARGLADATVLHAPEGCGGGLRLRLAAGSQPSGATLVVVGTHVPGAALRAVRVRRLPAHRPPRLAVRDAAARRIHALYGERAPLVDALVLGGMGSIDPRLRADFVASGLAHILSISGLHVGIVAAWLALGARALGLGPRAATLAAFGAWGYAAFLGFPAPATRAAAFVAIRAVARARQRHPSPGTVLAVAVLIVLAVDPGAVTDVGAWLSVAAVWGTTEAATALGPGARRPAALTLTAASVGAIAATAPISAFAFGQVAPAGLVTNLIAVPLAGVIVPGLLASLAVGSVLAAGTGLAMIALERIAALGAALPLGQITGPPGAGFALPWLLLLVALVWLVRRRPTWSVVAVRLSFGLAVLAWIGTVRTWAERERYAGLSVYVLDVGQGDAIAIRSPRGRWALVDAGPRLTPGADAGRDVVAPFLRRQGVRSLDLMVVSHGDADHLGGVPAVLAAVPARMVLEPGQPLGTALYGEYLAGVDAANAGWRAARRGDVVELDGVRLAVLHPTSAWVAREARPNENSVVLRVTFGAFDLLLTGDVGWPVESLLVDSLAQVEVLKVGHHGSAGSTRDVWLERAGPRVAMVSVGAGNRYGHPAPAVLARLAARGIAVYRTDRDGTVTVRSDGRYLEVQRGRTDPLPVRFLCLVRDWLPSRASSSNRSGCSPKPPGSSRTSYTTWPSLPR